MRFRGAFGIVALAALIVAAPAAATTIETETDGDDFGSPATAGTCTLREAIEAARTNQPFGGCPKGSATKRDVIQVVGAAFLSDAGNTATNADGDLDYDRGGKLTIRGSDAFNPIAISGFGAWSDRILEVRREAVKLVGVELQNGDTVGDADSAGGAIRATNGANLVVRDSELTGNAAGNRGGAIACEGCGSVKLLGNFVVSGNTATGQQAQGGAIWSNRPVTISGFPADIALPGAEARISNNEAISPGTDAADDSGGAIYAGGDLTVLRTAVTDNSATNGAGGGIVATGQTAHVEIVNSSVADNDADHSGGGLRIAGGDATLVLRRSSVSGNTVHPDPEFGDARGGGLDSSAVRNTITESVIDGNGGTAVMGAGIRGGGMILGEFGGSGLELTRLVRSSVTNNAIGNGQFQQGGGIYVSGRLEAVNSTVSSNTSFGSGGRGGGIQVALESIGDEPFARLDFTTVANNSAGTEGSQLWVQTEASLRASLLSPIAGDACHLSGDGVVSSRGYNVYAGADVDCGIDHPDDETGNPNLASLQENGSPGVGYLAAEVPLTQAVSSATSSALDLLPPGKCKVAGKPLKSDARGAPRPAEDGCEAGAIERTSCLGFIVAGGDSHIGRNAGEEIQGSFGANDVVLARGGDDSIRTYSGFDRICAGKGDDFIQPQADDDDLSGGPGTDIVNYNNAMAGGLGIDLAAQLATGPSIGSDDLIGIENAQGSEDEDDVNGDAGRNLLIGGGGPDELRGRGGIDILDAREPGGGDPDDVIDCGPGDNSKERAIVDPEDPNPINC